MPTIQTKKRVLVTGGAGFLGSHLCARLLQEGHEVICLDNFYSSNEDNVLALQRHSGFRLLEHDITFPVDVKVDEIYNLACPASPVHYQRDPVQTVKTNVLGALNVLELARRCNARVLQASTSEVYGDPIVHPQPESYNGNVNPIGVRSCYDEGKRCAETLFFDHHRQYGVHIKVARIFNTYGPHMHPDDGRVVSNFFMQALQGKDITLYGDGQQTRSFCYVSDLIDGLVRLMASPDWITGPVNLGNPEELQIRDLAERILAITGSESQLRIEPLPENDPLQRKPDITLAQSLLQWQPRISLHDGLRMTHPYFAGLTQDA
ncbi:SDR family oxidoreductase [Diaphorobacter sp. HDW4A]|uniref:UDP-glucuronic acid decarboxylase family protein n=1 Tax=Diaphorobacter sp. HDW4A TaxID=2714924 RepID=UPI001408620D|nr:UDP-glucuronic acid decarboxylase family protein [Diaphorobacter sp. HDW4A]QIL79530.1 SDR family oxidoreductase [Diaphorobacter sp. HDW4A]